MAHKLKATITTKQYIEQQIIDQLNKEIIYKAQLKVIEKQILDKDKKENAIKAVAALQEQLKAVKATLKAWEEYYLEFTKQE